MITRHQTLWSLSCFRKLLILQNKSNGILKENWNEMKLCGNRFTVYNVTETSGLRTKLYFVPIWIPFKLKFGILWLNSMYLLIWILLHTLYFLFLYLCRVSVTVRLPLSVCTPCWTRVWTGWTFLNFWTMWRMDLRTTTTLRCWPI